MTGFLNIAPDRRSRAMARSRSTRGFTLAELLVVIAIIAVLLALLLPGIVAARARTNTLICANNVRQICQALIGYASDNRGNFPPNTVAPGPGAKWSDKDRIGRYLRNGTVGPSGELRSLILSCPDDPGAARSYAMNLWASSATSGSYPPGKYWKLSVGNASRMILITESWSGLGSTNEGWLSRTTVGDYGPLPGPAFGAGGGLYPQFLAGRFWYVKSQLAYYRHRLPGIRLPITTPVGRVNIGYADGHVALKSNDDLANAATGLSTLDSWWSPMDQELNH